MNHASAAPDVEGPRSLERTSYQEMWVNGGIVSIEAAQTGLLSHALHYGSSVFEGTRVYGGRPFLLNEHCNRLHKSAAVLGFSIPWTVAELAEATDRVVSRSGLRECYVRTLAWVGDGKLEVGMRGRIADVAIAAWAWPSYYSGAGVALGLSPWSRPSAHTAPVAAKGSANYVIGSLSRDAARARGFDDALLATYDGLVAEATGANIFAVFDDTIVTPLPTCFLDGLTRRTVIELAADRGWTVQERPISFDELYTASEVFLTGTAVEIMPVIRIEATSFPVGPYTSALAEIYRALVRQA